MGRLLSAGHRFLVVFVLVSLVILGTPASNPPPWFPVDPAQAGPALPAAGKPDPTTGRLRADVPAPWGVERVRGDSRGAGPVVVLVATGGPVTPAWCPVGEQHPAAAPSVGCRHSIHLRAPPPLPAG